MSLSRLSLLSAMMCLCLSAAHANRVQARIEGELLVVFGDNVANTLLISQNAAGDLLIRGSNGTRVNGLAEVRFPAAILNACEVRMEGGNDSLSLEGLTLANDLYVNLGAGDDRLASNVAISVGANAAIEGESGNDEIRLTGSSIGEDLAISGGIGRLNAQVVGLLGGKGVTVIGDEANDTISISSSVAADYVSVETKGGNDSITLSGILCNGLGIASDAGIDTLSLTDISTSEDVGIFTGVANDRVSLTGVQSGKSLIVSVDEGSDFVSATSVSAVEDAVFEGGAGIDTLVDVGISGGSKFDVKEFEILLP